MWANNRNIWLVLKFVWNIGYDSRSVTSIITFLTRHLFNLQTLSRSGTALANDSKDEESLLVGSKSSKNETYIESDAGDTPVQRPTRRIVRVIESDEEMSDQDDVSNYKETVTYVANFALNGIATSVLKLMEYFNSEMESVVDGR